MSIMRKIYEIDAKRIIRRFLILPRLVDNEKRWLELAEIEQKLVFVKYKWKWVDVQWINK